MQNLHLYEARDRSLAVPRYVQRLRDALHGSIRLCRVGIGRGELCHVTHLQMPPFGGFCHLRAWPDQPFFAFFSIGDGSTARAYTASKPSEASMAFFKTNDPEKVLASDLKNAVAARDKHAALVIKAEAGVTAATKTAAALAGDAVDDAELLRAESEVRCAVDLLARRRTALGESEARIVTLQADLATAIDVRTRTATAAEVATITTDIQSCGEAAVVAISKLAAIAERVAMFVPESGGLNGCCVSLQMQLPDALNFISTEMGNYAAKVLRGEAAAVLPKPVAPYAPPPAPVKEPTQTLFVLRNIKWKDAAGQLRLGGQFTDVELPVRLVAKVLKSGACLPLTDPRRRQLKGSRGGQHPRHDAIDLTDLDAPESEQPVRAAEPVLHQAFTPIDRGGPIQLKVAR